MAQQEKGHVWHVLHGELALLWGAWLAWGLHGHAATSPSPPPAARSVPELAQLQEGGWCWQVAKCLLPSPQTRQVSPVCQPALQWDCSWVFIMSPLHQCIFCASMCSPEPQPNIPQLNIPQPMQRHPAQCHLVKDTFPFSLDKVPPSVFFLVSTARVVASAVPHFPGLPAHPSWAFVGDQWGGRREH